MVASSYDQCFAQGFSRAKYSFFLEDVTTGMKRSDGLSLEVGGPWSYKPHLVKMVPIVRRGLAKSYTTRFRGARTSLLALVVEEPNGWPVQACARKDTPASFRRVWISPVFKRVYF